MRRSRFQFRLRSLLFLVTATAVVLGAWGWIAWGVSTWQQRVKTRVTDFTDSDACKVLARFFLADEPIGRELSAGRFERDEAGDCRVVTNKGQVIFNIKTGEFTIVQGRNKSGDPRRTIGEFYVSNGELLARFVHHER